MRGIQGLSDDVLSNPFRKAVVGCEFLDTFDFIGQFAWGAESFSSVDKGAYPGDLVAPFGIALIVNKLCCVCLIPVDRNSGVLYFEVQEIWNTILELVKCDLK